jgi:hypothetical protein
VHSVQPDSLKPKRFWQEVTIRISSKGLPVTRHTAGEPRTEREMNLPSVSGLAANYAIPSVDIDSKYRQLARTNARIVTTASPSILAPSTSTAL